MESMFVCSQHITGSWNQNFGLAKFFPNIYGRQKLWLLFQNITCLWKCEFIDKGDPQNSQTLTPLRDDDSLVLGTLLSYMFAGSETFEIIW